MTTTLWQILDIVTIFPIPNPQWPFHCKETITLWLLAYWILWLSDEVFWINWNWCGQHTCADCNWCNMFQLFIFLACRMEKVLNLVERAADLGTGTSVSRSPRVWLIRNACDTWPYSLILYCPMTILGNNSHNVITTLWHLLDIMTILPSFQGSHNIQYLPYLLSYARWLRDLCCTHDRIAPVDLASMLGSQIQTE